VSVNGNLLDRVIGYIDPHRGARRMRSRAVMAMAGAYLGARLDRRATEKWNTSPNSADEDSIHDLPTLRSRSRDLARNTPLATGALLTMVINVIGTGLSLLARPDWKFLGMREEEADEWAAHVEREFRVWASSPDSDVTRIQNFYLQQSLVFRSMLESGDVFVLMPMIERGSSPYSLAIQVIEADRVDYPGTMPGMDFLLPGGRRIRGGVEMDALGAPVAYHILREHPGSTSAFNLTSDRVPAFGERTGRRNVLHIFERTRPGQTRGIPMLAPVIEPLKQLDRYTEAELMAAVITSMLAVFVKSETGQGFEVPAEQDPNTARTKVELQSGTITDLRPGESIESVSPTRPNTSFDPFVQAILRQVGVSLGLPFEVLIKHFTASYSAARAALLEAWKFYRLRREFLAQAFCAPVYEAFLAEAIARGRVQAKAFFDDPFVREAYLQAEWIGDAPGQIDPNKEVEAAKTAIETGLSSREREAMRLYGHEYSDVHHENVKDKNRRKADGLEAEPVAAAPNGKPAAAPQEQPGRDTEEEDKG